MKKVYHKFMSLLVVLVAALQANAGTWSYDWPKTAVADKTENNGFINGFYNFSSSKDPELTTQTRTFLGNYNNEEENSDKRVWTIDVSSLPGCILSYTSSGQTIGSGASVPVSIGLMSESFEGKIKRVTAVSYTHLTLPTSDLV